MNDVRLLAAAIKNNSERKHRADMRAKETNRVGSAIISAQLTEQEEPISNTPVNDDVHELVPREQMKIKNRLISKLRKKVSACDHDIDIFNQRNKKLQGQNNSLRCKLRRMKTKLKGLKPSDDDVLALEDLVSILCKYGGLSRFTITDDVFHQRFPQAAHTLFGFKSWEEMKIMVQCLFPNTSTEATSSQIKATQDHMSIALPPLTSFEKCLNAKMLFEQDLTEEFLGLIFGKDRTWIGRVLKEWAPRWGKAREWLSTLDVTMDFFAAKEPDDAVKLGLRNRVLIDGIDVRTEVKRSDLTVQREKFSSKQGIECGRALNFTGAGGTSFEHTKFLSAHISEHGVLQWKGSTKIHEVDVVAWKNSASSITKQQIAALKLETALDNIVTNADVLQFVNTADSLLAGGSAAFDDVILTGLPKAIKLFNATQQPDRNPRRVAKEEKKFSLSLVDEWFAERLVLKTTQQSSDKKKKSPFLSIEDMKDQNDNVLNGGVNSSAPLEIGSA